MKIAVYTIAKNEEKFAKRWADSCAEADYRVVLDTGSTDMTADVLADCGVTVAHATIEPWRFDNARNVALDLVPADADLCVTLDMDEVLQPGWRQAIEAVWHPGLTRIWYSYVWSWSADGTPGVQFQADRTHARHGYYWKHPVHETLKPCADTVERYARAAMAIHHHPDHEKPRSQYLPLLELSVREDPQDDRNAHYYGRELMFAGRYQEAIIELERHLSLPSATWKSERAASCRYIAQCHEAMGDLNRATVALIRSCNEEPNEREPWLYLARMLRMREQWPAATIAVNECLRRSADANTYLNDPLCRGSYPYHLGAVCAHYSGMIELSLEWIAIAARISPEDEAIRQDAEIMRGKAALAAE
jgi:tetratricopeptide (TPR) repeat protein